MQCPSCKEQDIGEGPWASWYRCVNCDVHPDTSIYMEKQRQEIATLKEQSAALREFWKRLCERMWDIWELDGALFQDWGEELGLLVKVTYDPEKHFSTEAEPGDDIYINALAED